MSATVAAAMPAASNASAEPVFGPRLAVGLVGILIAAMTAGMNNRVPGLALADVQGALGFASDDASWLNTVYAAGELAAMPFATWFAITFSLRRMHCWALGGMLLIAAVLPFVHGLPMLLALRAVQGVLSGALVPVLMMAALRFLPPPIRLHGLAVYAMTATFAPNVALWLAALCVDRLHDWRWVYWNVIPLGLFAMVLVSWGIPKMPMALPRLRQANWLGVALGIPGLALLVVGLDQGVRLDWFNSPLIKAALLVGVTLTALFLISESRHSAPFVRLQLLKRRNLGAGFSVFFVVLVVLMGGVGLPANVMMHMQGFRLEQVGAIGLMVGLPQLVLGPVVALFLYQRWVDARWMFALGLLCIATGCLLCTGLTSAWMVREFIPAEVLQAVGQPMAVISMLFLSTSVVHPSEGPSVAGIVNTIRVFGTVAGGAFLGQLTTLRSNFHAEMLADRAVQALPRLMSTDGGMNALGSAVNAQASVLAAIDVYRVFGLMALFLIPLVLKLQYIPAPVVTPSPRPVPAH